MASHIGHLHIWRVADDDVEATTIAESGVPGYSYDAGHGICTHGAAPPAIIAALGREIAAIPRMPDVRERLIGMASEPVGSTPQEFKTLMEEEVPRIEAPLRPVGPQPR